jgi:hypothetical protein
MAAVNPTSTPSRVNRLAVGSEVKDGPLRLTIRISAVRVARPSTSGMSTSLRRQKGVPLTCTLERGSSHGMRNEVKVGKEAV